MELTKTDSDKTEPSLRWVLGVSLAMTAGAMVLGFFRSLNVAIVESRLPDDPSVLERLRYLVSAPQHPIPFYFFGMGVYWILFRTFGSYIKIPSKILGVSIPKVTDPAANSDPLVRRYLDRWYFLTGIAVVLLAGQYFWFLMFFQGFGVRLCMEYSVFCPIGSFFLNEFTFCSIFLFSFPTIRFLSKHALFQAEASETGQGQMQFSRSLLHLPKRIGAFSFIVFIIGVANPFIFKFVFRFSALYLGD
jgi:hypothetical protein